MLEEYANLIGVAATDNEEIAAIRATNGHPQDVMVFIIKDYTNIGIWEDILYVYNGKFYEKFSDERLEKLIYGFYVKNGLRKKFNLNKKNELKFSIKNHHKVLELDFDKPENLINLKNGVLDLETYELTPHDRKHQFSYVIDVDYNKEKVNCPKFDKFVDGIFATGGSWEKGFKTNKKDVENIIMMCGYLIYPKIKAQGKLFIMLGEGQNGKSILLDTIRMFFNKKFITSLGLSTIADERSFHRESIVGSRINICSEQKGGKVDSEELKKIISGENISIQRKFKNGALSYDPTTKIIVAANNMPFFNDTTHGTVRRLILFNFKNKFVHKDDYEKEVHPEKYGIFEELNDDDMMAGIRAEKSAILNKFIGGLQKLKERNWRFIDTYSTKRILEEYRKASDVLGTWLSENYVKAENNNFISIGDIYEEFSSWYRDNYGRNTNNSTASIGRKVAERFRIESEIQHVGGKKTFGYRLQMKQVSFIDEWHGPLQEVMSEDWGKK